MLFRSGGVRVGLKLNKELKGEKCLATVMLVTMEDIRQDKVER